MKRRDREWRIYEEKRQTEVFASSDTILSKKKIHIMICSFEMNKWINIWAFQSVKPTDHEEEVTQKQWEIKLSKMSPINLKISMHSQKLLATKRKLTAMHIGIFFSLCVHANSVTAYLNVCASIYTGLECAVLGHFSYVIY